MKVYILFLLAWVTPPRAYVSPTRTFSIDGKFLLVRRNDGARLTSAYFAFVITDVAVCIRYYGRI